MRPLPIALTLALLAPSSLAATTLEFDLTYAGSFRITFGTGPDGTDELFFSGAGGGEEVGDSTVDGYSQQRAAPGPEGLCVELVHDDVVVTRADGAGSLAIANEGRDCIDALSQPGAIRVVGAGEGAVVGGTGVYAGAAGAHAWEVEAVVTGAFVGGVEGEFTRLRFAGALWVP